MERHIPEADRKLLRRLEPIALDRLCRRILAEVAGVAGDEARGGHERYLAVCQLVRDQYAEMAAAASMTRRSSDVSPAASGRRSPGPAAGRRYSPSRRSSAARPGRGGT